MRNTAGVQVMTGEEAPVIIKVQNTYCVLLLSVSLLIPVKVDKCFPISLLLYHSS